jgi:hypothetical protein
VPTEMLTKREARDARPLLPMVVSAEDDWSRADAARRQVKRARRLRIHAVAWLVGATLITTLWAVNEWQDNGGLKSFGHEGDSGQWNPTLWALAVGVWALIVGIMALHVFFERPPNTTEINRELRKLNATDTRSGAELRRRTRARLERIGRLKFHIAAWVFGMVMLTPLWALIEWQDNGGFERFSNDSRPGEWEPWILYVAGIWALVIVIVAVRSSILGEPNRSARLERLMQRLRLRS